MTAEMAQLGLRLRAFRHERGLTLGELADRVRISPSTLSRLEADKRQATLALVLALTRELGISIDDLLPQGAGDPRVRRAVERRDGMIIAPLTLDRSPVQTFKVTYPPTPKAPASRVHDGYEWLYVLSGRIRLTLDKNEHIIDRGEAAEFDTRTPHSLSATAEGAAEIISIFSASGERMHTYGTS